MRKRLIAICIAVTAVLLAIAGVAYASIPAADGTIDGCYKNSTGMLIVIDSSAACPTGYTSLNWSQAGPQGPAGPQGATGAQGPAGPSTGGSSGLDLQIVRSSGTATATATCPSGHPFLYGGGGFDANGGNTGVSAPAGLPSASEPEDGNTPLGWFFEAANGANDTVVAYAICGK